jgi:tripartite-type tricarboxylate transporter receptor subunit TctC
MSLTPVINASVGCDPLRDFSHIAYIAGAPVSLTANTNIGVKTLPEFVRYAQANRFTFATAFPSPAIQLARMYPGLPPTHSR